MTKISHLAFTYFGLDAMILIKMRSLWISIYYLSLTLIIVQGKK